MPIAVLIDTVSIQAYIFGSNKLKENIGASYIIEHQLYRELIPQAIVESDIDPDLSIDEWKTDPGCYKLQEESDAKVEVGYIGGGNALLLFQKEADAKTFIKVYSRLVLLHYPGIRVTFATGELPYEDDFSERRKELNEELRKNKERHPVYVLPFKHGIVKDCALSNEGQEINYSKDFQNISYSAAVRLQAAETSQTWINEQYEPLLQGKKEKYAFTTEIDQLGQPDDKGYVAVVHADGNGMGKRFMKCKSLQEMRELSADVADLADHTMTQLVQYIVNCLESKKIGKDNGFDIKKDEQDRLLLPIRPIIAGGDDITLVCEGKLGVHLAEKLLEFMTKEVKVGGEYITACAGVAIVHTKYPFYRTYRLSEELIKEAKKASRQKDDSWLSFMVSTGGFSGNREDILQQKYTLPNGDKLTMNPYRFSQGDHALQQLKDGIQDFHDQWPRNKQMALRDVLRKDEAGREYFLTELAARKKPLSLPGFGKHYGSKSIWYNRQTPYFDMVELMPFYPKELL